MDLKIVQLFIRFCTAYALEQCNYNKENKHFSHSKQEQFLISLLEESLVIARFLLDAKTIISIYDALKGLYPGVDQPEKAIHCYENIRTFMSGTGEAEMNIDNRIGLFYHIKGESRKAIENQEKSLSIAKEIGHRRGQERAYACLGVAYHLSGEYQKSIECYEKAVNMAKVIGYRGEESNNYGKLGLVYFELGEYHKAFEYHEKRLSITKEIGDREGEGAAYQFLGVVYFALGEYHKAIEHYEKSLSIAKEIGDRLGEIDIYGNLGGAYRLLGEYHKAIQYHEKSLSIAKEADIMKQFKFEIYGSLGVDYASLGEHHKAIKYYKKSLSQAKKTGHRQGQGDAYGNLGIAYYFLGKYHKAIQYYEKSMIIHKETGDRLGQAGLHHNMGLVYEKESSIKDLNKSKEHLKKSIQCYKKIFDDLKDNDQFKVSIVDTFIKTYKFLSQVYIKTRQSEEALLVCEHGRARALIDFLFLKCNKTEKAKSKELELADVKTISSHREGCILFYSLHSNKVTYHSWVISSRSPFTFFYDETDNREALATIVSSLSEDEGKNTEAGYFQYLVDNCFQQLNVREGKGMKCENRSMNLLEHEDLECAPSTNSSQLSEIALKGFHKVDRCIPEEEGDDVEPLDMLFYRLVSPVLDQLIHDEVIIIPDGHLFMVPFAALQDPKTGKYLSETKRIRLAPSLTTLKILQESSHDQHDGSGALIIGNPTTGHVRRNGRTVMFSPLPGAEDEAIQIGNLLSVQPLIGSQATKKTVLRRLQQGLSIIHFAAHGSKENGQIALAPSKPTTYSSPAEEKDCILTMTEVQESGIRAQLVVLSCCYSGRGDIKSEGVVGMTRAFLAAGARAVVASLWAIDDTATKFFMLKFYSHLKNGESASKSLQQAMKDMREIYEEPMYWAGFFLIGDDVTITV